MQIYTQGRFKQARGKQTACSSSAAPHLVPTALPVRVVWPQSHATRCVCTAANNPWLNEVMGLLASCHVRFFQFLVLFKPRTSSLAVLLLFTFCVPSPDMRTSLSRMPWQKPSKEVPYTYIHTHIHHTPPGARGITVARMHGVCSPCCLAVLPWPHAC